MNHELFKFLAMFCICITICICACLVTTLKSTFYPSTLFETARCALTYAYRYRLTMASFPRCLTCSKFAIGVNRGVATSTESPPINGDVSNADISEIVDNIDSVIIPANSLVEQDHSNGEENIDDEGNDDEENLNDDAENTTKSSSTRKPGGAAR